LTLPAPLTADSVTRREGFQSLLKTFLQQRVSASVRSAAARSVAANLRLVGNFLRNARLEKALRQVDSDWRHHPDQAATLAPIYGGLLMLEGRDHDAALRLLRRAIDDSPDADVAALIALSLWRLQRPEDARSQIELALASYCVVPHGLLFHVAGELAQRLEAPGWIARDPDLALVGELAPYETANVLDIRVDGQSAYTQLLRISAREGGREFSFKSPHPLPVTKIDVGARGRLLLGSGAGVPSDFGLDGRAEATGRRLTGWARLGWLPHHRVYLRIEDGTGRRSPAKTGRGHQPGWRWPFAIDLRARRMRGHRIHLSAQLPDGRWQPLPDAPLLLDSGLRQPAGRAVSVPNWRASSSRTPRETLLLQNQRGTDVIVPVYRGRKESLACIESVLATIDDMARVVVVDDATEDVELAAALDVMAGDRRITLLRNVENQGFVASVNLAMALDSDRDVVVLNADTRVFDNWLSRLRAAAYSAKSVGTATPLSNQGSIASYPHPAGAAIDPEDGAALHAVATATHSGVRAAIPVGVGFCLFIRRDCLNAVGSFDADVYGKGYGEETDFCLRASRAGWSHQLAADVFVYHTGGVSFGARRKALLDRSQRLIELHHPGYGRLIGRFLADDPLHILRRRLDEQRLFAFEGRFLLLVTLQRPGGVDRYLADRCRVLRAQGLHPLVLRPEQIDSTHRCAVSTDAVSVPNLIFDTRTELPQLVALLKGLSLEAIEIQHFLNLDARLIEALRKLPVPYDVVVHDYAWICPRVTLIDSTGRYCGEPPVSQCGTCVKRNGSNLGESISAPALRARSALWLAGARRVIAPSSDTAARLQRHFPRLAIQVQPHTVRTAVPLPPPRSSQNKIKRVALIGALGDHKGYRVLLACARDARARRLPLEFVVIGHTYDDARLLETGRVFITGRYAEAEAPHLLRREQPDVVWLSSVWPETWCYTLDYALDTGLPVAAFDLGAIAERLRNAGRGFLLPLDLRPQQINRQLLNLVGVTEPRAVAASGHAQTTSRLRRPVTDAATSGSGEIAMPNSSDGKRADEKPAQDAQPEGMSASVQLLPLPAGLYLFSVKSAKPVTARGAGQLSLPAVHVGLGPGTRADQVEFIAGPSTHGAWLFAPGDLLVTRINTLGATLVMTSVRAPGGDVLAIKVERLESRADEPAAPRSTAKDVPPSPALPEKAPVVQRLAATSKKTLPRVAAPAGVPAPPIPLPLQIQAHVRSRGDMSFADVPWAGRVAPGLWIESFSVRPLERFAAQDIEYKGLTGSGFETPWLSDDRMCGTRGMAVPLVGFAVRLKPSPAATAYDCEYSGYFQSGVVVGPLRNGAPCRSTVANDPLEGIQIRLIRRANTNGTANPLESTAKREKPHAKSSHSGRRSARSTRRQSPRRP
jgi:GT2 family glycosyltransferase